LFASVLKSTKDAPEAIRNKKPEIPKSQLFRYCCCLLNPRNPIRKTRKEIARPERQ
jgi:hypothetical protein